MFRTCYLIVTLLILASTASVAQAQVPTGEPPFGSFSGGPDVIDLANLNSQIVIQVRNKPGRQMDFVYNFSNDSSVWYPVTSLGTTTWKSVYNWGWRAQTEVTTGYLSFTETDETCQPFGGYQQYTGYVYHDQNGIAHLFAGTSTVAVSCGTNSPILSVTSDGSGYYLYALGQSNVQVTHTSGLNYSPPVLTGNGSGYGQDRNGNQITVSTSAVFTDTLGQAALSITGGTNDPTNPTLLTYTAPSGAPASYKISYNNVGIWTNFGCSSVGDYGPHTNQLVNTITLPDSKFYQVTYEPSPGHSGYYTGRVASIKLPTGGTITYAYTGGSSGHINCADGSTMGLTRVTPDGTWTYSRTLGSGAASTTTITDPQSNHTVIQFQGLYETQRDTYQGAISPSNDLQTRITCYNASANPCTSIAINLPITQKEVITTMTSGGTSTEGYYIEKYDPTYGLLTEHDDHDFQSGGGPLLKEVLYTYASLGNNIVGMPATMVVKNSGGTTIATTTYNYDEVAPTTTTAPQHVAISGSRGNLTSVQLPISGLVTQNRYYDTGMLSTSTGVNGGVTTYTYGTGSCGDSFATAIQEPKSTLSSSMTYLCAGGVDSTLTDENGKVSSLGWTDPDVWRVGYTKDQTTAETTYTYSGETQMETVLTNSGTSAADTLTTYDGLGRKHVQQSRQAPGSSTFDSTETDYDSVGRPSRITLPYPALAGATSSTAPAKTMTYDALDRLTQLSDAGGGTVTYSHALNDVLVTIGPKPTGEANTKQRQLEYNELGLLTSVCELTSGPGSGTCGQSVARTGYWTKYTYDALDDLLTVTQNAQAASSLRETRTYTYDKMGRPLSEANPETGSTTYTYDTDSTCGTISYLGDLIKRVDAVGNTTCYQYDKMRREVAATYTGPYSSASPTKVFVYDAATLLDGTVMTNAATHMAQTYTCATGCPSHITDNGFSYSARGELTDFYELAPHSSGYQHTQASFWPTGAIHTLAHLGMPLPTITYTLDGEGRISTVSDGSGHGPTTATSYNSASEVTAVTLGSGDSDAFQYDPNTGRMTQYKATVGSQAITGTPTWNASGSLNNLVISDPFNSSGSQTCNYVNDDLSRLSSVNCGTPWGQTFTYDAFGNISWNAIAGSGGSTFLPSYAAPPTNRFASTFGASYDNNGNLLNDTVHARSWDAENRPVTEDSTTLTYNAMGQMVEIGKAGVYTDIIYSPLGKKLSLVTGGTAYQSGFVPLPHRANAVYGATGTLAYYRHPDWLGSSRIGSTPSQTWYSDTAYSPFGEAYESFGSSDLSFTGQDPNSTTPTSASQVYDFPARKYYPQQARWVSPDPAGIGAVDPTDPQTWNRYVYVRNSPLAATDPKGMDPQVPLPVGGGADGGVQDPDGCDTDCLNAIQQADNDALSDMSIRLFAILAIQSFGACGPTLGGGLPFGGGVAPIATLAGDGVAQYQNENISPEYAGQDQNGNGQWWVIYGFTAPVIPGSYGPGTISQISFNNNAMIGLDFPPMTTLVALHETGHALFNAGLPSQIIRDNPGNPSVGQNAAANSEYNNNMLDDNCMPKQDSPEQISTDDPASDPVSAARPAKRRRFGIK